MNIRRLWLLPIVVAIGLAAVVFPQDSQRHQWRYHVTASTSALLLAR